jgi:hypothetical protein
MILYNLTDVKNQVFNSIKSAGEDKQVAFKKINELYSTRYAIDQLSVDTVYMIISDDPRFTFYIDEDHLAKINLFAKMNIGINLDLSNIKGTETENYYRHKVKDSTDLKEAVLAFKQLDAISGIIQQLEEERAIRKARLSELNRLYGVVDNSVMNKKIVSVDFEFEPNDKEVFQLSQISEIGFTFYEDGKTTSKHYLVEENRKESSKAFLQELFLFGDTEIIKTADIATLLQKTLDENEVLIVHGYSTELRFLDVNNIDYSGLDVYDTQLVFKQYFEENQPNLKRLSHMLQHFDIPYTFLHNAGNDSYHTFGVFQNMMENIPKPEMKKKISLRI